ncbi:MAG: hypothetical protein IPJ62_03750 [Betaproteobacteria bacterium]|nr:hypothetical protein [Betaproteobacteria bacterium]
MCGASRKRPPVWGGGGGGGGPPGAEKPGQCGRVADSPRQASQPVFD